MEQSLPFLQGDGQLALTVTPDEGSQFLGNDRQAGDLVHSIRQTTFPDQANHTQYLLSGDQRKHQQGFVARLLHGWR